MKTSIYLCTHLANLFLEREIFQTKFVEKIKTSILGQITFFRKSFLLWQNVGKHCTAGQATYENIIWLMLVILKATYTHSDYVILGQDGSVGIAPRYGLDGLGIESRWEAKFSARVPTSPGTHPAFYTMGNGSFLCTLPDRSWDPPNLLYNWYWVFPLHASRPVLGPTQPSIQWVLGLPSVRVPTGPGAHPTFYTKGTGSFPGVKRPGRGHHHPHLLAPRLRKE